MSTKTGMQQYMFYFVALYTLFYMSNAVFGTFVPVYLNHIGFSQTAIGSLLALGPFVAIIAQPVWGMAGDRAQTKNKVLQILVLGTALSALLYRFSPQYIYLVGVMTIFTFFQTSVGPLSDAITLEYIDKTGWKFSTVRMAGTVGYALMSVFAGMYAKRDIHGIFILYFFIAAAMFYVTFYLPKVKGHQSEGSKMSILALFKKYELVLLLGYATVLMATMGFFYAFFAIYFRQMGGDSGLLGWAMFISAIFEIPFLFFAHRIVDKLGPKFTLIGSGMVIALRWMLLYYVTNPYIILPLQALHGLSFIVISFTMVIYINKNVPKELKASGQTMFGLIGMGVSRIIATLFGGYISDQVGIRQVFYYNAWIIVIATLMFLALSSPYIKNRIEVKAKSTEGGMQQ